MVFWPNHTVVAARRLQEAASGGRRGEGCGACTSPATHHPAGLSADSPCSGVIGGGSTRPFAAGARCCSGGGLQAAAGVGGIAWRCRGTSQHSTARASLMPTDPSK